MPKRVLARCGRCLTLCALTVLCPWDLIVSESGSDGANARLNVILISLDTVRPDHLSCYGYPRQTSPHIDGIARTGALFTGAFSHAPQTFPSHLSLFHSRYPTAQWLEWEEGDLEALGETLPEILRRHGYATAAFVGFVSGQGKLAEGPLMTRPLQAFEDRTEGVWLSELPDNLFWWLTSQRERPFFLFLHGFDAHDPHVVPVRYDGKRFNRTYRGPLPSNRVDLMDLASLSIEEFGQMSLEAVYRRLGATYLEQLRIAKGVQPQDLHHMQAVYDAQIYYLDQGLGQLVQALKNLDLWERTALVIFSDHGQAFGEHGLYAAHAQSYGEVARIVLIVRDPRHRPRKRRVRNVVQAVDVMPTILELVGLPVPPTAVGRSLVPLLKTGKDSGREEVAVSAARGMRAIYTPAWGLISLADGTRELYQMQWDPGEQHNVAQREPAIVEALQRRLDEILPPENFPKQKPRDPGGGRGFGYW